MTHAALRVRRTTLTGVCLAALCAAGLFAMLHGHGFDDPYITYRYSINLAAGRGFVYNPGLVVLSTTAPLYGLLLSLPASLGLDLPTFSNLISCISFAAGALALWELGQAWSEPLAGLSAALLYPLFPLILITIGAETALLLALLLWTLVAAEYNRWPLAALLLALATLTRADAVLLGGLLGLRLLLRLRGGAQAAVRELPWGAGMLYLGIVAPGFILAQLIYGSPFPATLAAKRAQSFIPNSRTFGQGLSDYITEIWALPLYRPLFIAAAIGLLYGLLRRRAALWLPAWAALYTLAYTLLRVNSYFWYYTPTYLGLLVLASLGVAGMAALLQSRLPARFATAGALLLLAAMLGAELRDLPTLARTPDQRLAVYRSAGEWLRANTAPTSSVGTLEIGIIGFYSERPMIDFAGLIQPEVTALFRQGLGYLEAGRWALDRYKPAYVVVQESGYPLIEGAPALAQRCAVQVSFPDQRFPLPLRIYRCVWAAGS